MTTVAPATVTTVRLPPAPLPGLGKGSTGPEVHAVEQRLADLRYDPGKIDGVFDGATLHAVTAFQKVQSMPRTGRVGQHELDVMSQVGSPGPMLPSAEPTRVEIDLPRQMIQLYIAGKLERVVPVSTGSGRRYCVDRQCAVAVTPGGSFRITRRIPGWRKSRLGLLYNPLYFNGGIAIHGAPSVPAYPASHGCVRIPMYVADWFARTVPNGTPVYVLGGKRAPVPFNEPTPSDESTTTSSTTTTEPSTTTTGVTYPPSATTSTTVA